MTKKLTICICAYNAERYIQETLDSLGRQERNDFDVWIIDDASQDNTKRICEEQFLKYNWDKKNKSA